MKCHLEVRREYRDQQCNQSPRGKHVKASNKEHRPKDDFCDSARNNKAHVPGEVGRHDADVK